jgi:hypothetical protein
VIRQWEHQWVISSWVANHAVAVVTDLFANPAVAVGVLVDEAGAVK